MFSVSAHVLFLFLFCFFSGETGIVIETGTARTDPETGTEIETGTETATETPSL